MNSPLKLPAFGGGCLLGSKWVRVLYLDESGIGNIHKDPILAVAGVLIHGDTQWGPIADRLRTILDDAPPPGVKRPRFLHAKDIFHGSREFPRRDWPEELRYNILDQVGAIPAEFDVPVVWAAMDRRVFAEQHPKDSDASRLRDVYTVCALTCIMEAEIYMRSLKDSEEVCSITIEQNHELQKRIPEMIDFIREPGEETANLIEGWERCIPLKKIIDTPSCQPKSASSILQLADYCAFAIKRRLQQSFGGGRLVAPIAPQLLLYKSPDDVESEKSLWNPKFMPAQWGHKIIFKEGEFVMKDQAGETA